MQRDPDAPTVRRGPDQEHAQCQERRHAENRVRSPEAEVNQRDDGGNRQTVADDRERPGVSGIAFVDEAADGTLFEVMRPSLEQASFTTVGTALGYTATK